MPDLPLKRRRYLLLAVMICVLVGACTLGSGLARSEDPRTESPTSERQPPTVVVEEEPAVVVADEKPAVVTGEEGPPHGSWNPQPAVVGRHGDRTFYLRPAGEAFLDPDSRRSLEIKYYFPLSEPPDMPVGSLSHAKVHAAGARLLLAPQASLKFHTEVFPISVHSGTSTGRIELEWLDYHVRQPQLAVLLVTGRTAAAMSDSQPLDTVNTIRRTARNRASGDSEQSSEASLQVLRLQRHGDGWEVTRARVVRTFAGVELPVRWMPGGLLDTWDRWPDLGQHRAFVGRVIAVLKQIGDRYAVDFYGELLHEDSDCRVWLSPVQHAWGRPIAIRFVELPVRKGPEAIGRVSALAIYYEDAQSSGRWVAIDYPLCRSPMLEQMRQIALRFESRSAGRSQRPPPQLSDIVGADLADELERRLVDGVYR